MEFIWDEKKNRLNIKKHGFDFADAWQVFDKDLLASLDDSQDYGEERWIGIGMLNNGTVVLIVFVEEDNDAIRIISLRKANRNEKSKYEEKIKDGLGSH
jgi:hypothetical protein